MAISSVRKNSTKGASRSKLSPGGANSASTTGADKIAQATKNSDLTFKERVSHTSTVSAGDAVDIFLPNGKINDNVLQTLQDNVHIAGDLLMAKPGYNTVLEYKNSIQALLKSIVPHLHKKEQFDASKVIDGKVTERKFILISQVNQKLDTVLKIVMTSQPNQLKMMQMLDEIRGLIVNILH